MWRELPAIRQDSVPVVCPTQSGWIVFFISRLRTLILAASSKCSLHIAFCAHSRPTLNNVDYGWLLTFFCGKKQEFESCPLPIHLYINMWDSLYSLENQQKASSLQGQTQQVQRIWTAGCLSSQLGNLVLLRGGDGEWSSQPFSSGKEMSKELYGKLGAIP